VKVSCPALPARISVPMKNSGFAAAEPAGRMLPLEFAMRLRDGVPLPAGFHFFHKKCEKKCFPAVFLLKTVYISH